VIGMPHGLVDVGIGRVRLGLEQRGGVMIIPHWQ
jgi:hypothetical protein